MNSVNSDRLVLAALVAGFAVLPVAHAATEDDDLRQQIVALRAEQARIAQMQQATEKKLAELEARLGASTRPLQVASNTALQSAAAEAESPLNVSGDMRVRAQGDYDDRVRDRTSAQVRARLGATYQVSELVAVGARLVTGDPDDPNSTDVQLSSFDDDLQVSLDQAYVQLNFGDARVFGGKIPQPFTRTELVWDGDVNPQGVSVMYKHPLGSDSAIRANGIFFIVDEDAVGPESTMTGAQLGYDLELGEEWTLGFDGAYYDYRLGSTGGADDGDFRDNLRNPDGSYLSDFDLADIIVGATWAGAGSRWPVRLVGDYVRNVGAATAEDSGFGVDLSLGRLKESGDWRLTYGYSLAETDAVLAAFSHDNIALGTNYRLHALTFEYVPWAKTQLSAIWYHYRTEAPALGAENPWIDRLRLALTVGF
jgi:hypothetical protein